MTNRFEYYVELLVNACGFNSIEKVSGFGIIIVIIATFALIYAADSTR